MLDEPALRTAIASAIGQALTARAGPARRAARDEQRATAQEASRVVSAVGAAGQDDRHARAEHDAGGVGAGQEGQALGQHVAGLEVGHDQHVGAPGDRRDDVLDRRRLEADRVVERQRPVEHARR